MYPMVIARSEIQVEVSATAKSLRRLFRSEKIGYRIVLPLDVRDFIAVNRTIVTKGSVNRAHDTVANRSKPRLQLSREKCSDGGIGLDWQGRRLEIDSVAPRKHA